MKYILIGILALGLVSCDLGPQSPEGFSLPNGNIDDGRRLVLMYKCLTCHRINGLEPPDDLIDNPEISVLLGGKSVKVKTYADLLTSIINPSHKFARGYKLKDIQDGGVSKMTNYNDVMTVTELINLVTFLQSNYELTPYKSTNYQYYGY